MLSIIRTTSFEPVGIVIPEFAAVADTGLTTRWLLGSKRGSADGATTAAGATAGDAKGTEAAAGLSSPN
jgi:hypothetical protein